MRLTPQLTTLAAALAILTVPACAGNNPHDGPAMNYHRIDKKLATSGHFVGDGLNRLTNEGVTLIIDLRAEPPSDQVGQVEAAGVRYVNLPVSWEAPMPEDFRRFANVLAKYPEDSVLVQCAANYRASAMTYLYRTLVLGVAETDAARDLHAVWEPNDVWQKYMASVRQQYVEVKTR